MKTTSMKTDLVVGVGPTLLDSTPVTMKEDDTEALTMGQGPAWTPIIGGPLRCIGSIVIMRTSCNHKGCTTVHVCSVAVVTMLMAQCCGCRWGSP